MNRLKQLRDEKKWTQKYLGSLLHVKNAAISKYETGRASLTEETIVKAANLFNVTTDYLLGLSDNREGIAKPLEPITIVQKELSEEEKKLITYYKRLDDENKDYIKGRMVDLYKEQQKNLAEKNRKNII